MCKYYDMCEEKREEEMLYVQSMSRRIETEDNDLVECPLCGSMEDSLIYGVCYRCSNI